LIKVAFVAGYITNTKLTDATPLKAMKIKLSVNANKTGKIFSLYLNTLDI
jgi:hypothetical protein